jgi:hypothetical protein
MIDTALAYLISCGMVIAGVAWIVEGMRAGGSVFFVAVGVSAIATGVASFVSELENKAL